MLYGSSAGLSLSFARPPQFWNQDLAINPGRAQSGNHFGSSLTAWNFGRNELKILCSPSCVSFPVLTTDLAIGVPFENVAGVNDAGAVDVMYGSFSSNGLTATGNVVFTADSIGIGGLPGAHFGAALY